MESDRYSSIDLYVLERLKLEYKAGNVKDRIRLLARLTKRKGPFDFKPLPYEIALLALEDPDSLVRAWVAKNGALDHELYMAT